MSDSCQYEYSFHAIGFVEGKALPERGTFFRLEIYKKPGISRYFSTTKDQENRYSGINRSKLVS